MARPKGSKNNTNHGAGRPKKEESPYQKALKIPDAQFLYVPGNSLVQLVRTDWDPSIHISSHFGLVHCGFNYHKPNAWVEIVHRTTLTNLKHLCRDCYQKSGGDEILPKKQILEIYQTLPKNRLPEVNELLQENFS